tara:strand:- start:200 stop:403 length:204 start_codon:yes stop_codon:yes gene_type:complete
MDKQRKQLAKIIETVTNQYFCINGVETMSLNKQQDELLSSVITHLMLAQSELNKYVNNEKSTRKANT